jgi:hypothetical protein
MNAGRLNRGLEQYVRARIAAMDFAQRVALGVLEDSAVARIMLGAIWGLELAAEADPGLPVEPSQGVTPSGPAAEAAHPQPLKLFWLHVPHRIVGHKRYLVEIIGDGHARTSHKTGVLVPKVLTRTYLARSRRWTASTLKPVAWFTDAASLDDPLVRDALTRRP